MDNQKIGNLKAQFNSISVSTTDPSLLIGKVIVHDFEKSWNNQIITEEVCLENMNTLIGKRIVCKYISSEDNDGIDALGDHAEKIGKSRDNSDMMVTETLPIGFINNVYIDDYTDENGNTKRALFADVVIWNDEKFSNVTGLLQEWLSRGIKIHMSVEYLYCNYEFKDGVEILKSPILYVAHTLLNSEDRGNCVEVLPSYDSATLISLNDRKLWNKAINTAIKQSNGIDIENNKKEGLDRMDNIFIKSLNSISLGDVRGKLYEALSKIVTNEVYEYLWISSYNILPDDHIFIYETYENGEWVNYKVGYSMNENDITVDYEGRTKVSFKSEWVAVADMQVIQTSLNEKNVELTEANTKIDELTNSLNTKDQDIVAKDELITSLNSTVETLETEKSDLTTKFNEQTDVVVSLNAKVKEYEPIVEEHNTALYEKALNSAIEFYKEKFESVGAIEEFEKEETQELIKKSINSKESTNAKFALNELIVLNVKSSNSKKDDEDIVPDIKASLNATIKGKENKDLMETEDIFEKTYGFKK